MTTGVYCDRCGTEIPAGWPVAQYFVDGEWLVMHRFSTECDSEGVKFVEGLHKRYEQFKLHDPAD